MKTVIDEADKPAGLRVNESFVEFFPMPNHTASELKDLILNYRQVNNIDLKTYKGQAYDGARLMSGAYNGLKAKIEELEEN